MGATDQERKKLTLLKIFHLLSVFLRELIPREMTLRIINNYSSGSESSWAIDSEAMRAKGIIVLVKSNQLVKNIENKKNFSQLKLDFNPFLPPKSARFSLLVGYNIQPSSSSTNQNTALIINHQLDFPKMKYICLLSKKLVPLIKTYCTCKQPKF